MADKKLSMIGVNPLCPYSVIGHTILSRTIPFSIFSKKNKLVVPLSSSNSFPCFASLLCGSTRCHRRSAPVVYIVRTPIFRGSDRFG